MMEQVTKREEVKSSGHYTWGSDTKYADELEEILRRYNIFFKINIVLNIVYTKGMDENTRKKLVEDLSNLEKQGRTIYLFDIENNIGIEIL